MEEQFRSSYFPAIRMGILLALEIYIAFTQFVMTGASVKMLLLLALLIGGTAGQEMSVKYRKIPFFIGSALVIVLLGREYLLLAVFLCYEILSCIRPKIFWYMLPWLISFVPTGENAYVQVVIAFFLGVIYMQHDFLVAWYQEQLYEDTVREQGLKRDMYQKEHQMQEKLRETLLMAENRMLEERAGLSQTLHDRLGHNINGSVYQLEAVKVLMDKEPVQSKNMIQAVIDQLRGGMDEIRVILRKERPGKDRLTLLQLERLCKDCRSKGVQAELFIEGELSQIPETYMEIILDNAYEAVSNSLKYAKCTAITIDVHVLNKVVRCRIADNGIGCEQIKDGMGIAGMRRRVREVNGILSFDTAFGFSINMLLPL